MRSDICIGQNFFGAIFTPVIYNSVLKNICTISMMPWKFETIGRFSGFRFVDFLEIRVYESKLYELKNYMSWKIIWVEIIWAEIIWVGIIWVEIIWNVEKI